MREGKEKEKKILGGGRLKGGRGGKQKGVEGGKWGQKGEMRAGIGKYC